MLALSHKSLITLQQKKSSLMMEESISMSLPDRLMLIFIKTSYVHFSMLSVVVIWIQKKIRAQHFKMVT